MASRPSLPPKMIQVWLISVGGLLVCWKWEWRVGGVCWRVSHRYEALLPQTTRARSLSCAPGSSLNRSSGVMTVIWTSAASPRGLEWGKGEPGCFFGWGECCGSDPCVTVDASGEERTASVHHQHKKAQPVQQNMRTGACTLRRWSQMPMRSCGEGAGGGGCSLCRWLSLCVVASCKVSLDGLSAGLVGRPTFGGAHGRHV